MRCKFGLVLRGFSRGRNLQIPPSGLGQDQRVRGGHVAGNPQALDATCDAPSRGLGQISPPLAYAFFMNAGFVQVEATERAPNHARTLKGFAKSQSS